LVTRVGHPTFAVRIAPSTTLAASKKTKKKSDAGSAAAATGAADLSERLTPTPAHLEQTLTEMQAVLAGIPAPEEPVPTDYVQVTLHLVLGKGVPCGIGQEALRRVLEEFVDLNEVRVTEAYEIEELLEDLGIPDTFDRCLQARDVVAQIYNDQNGVSLEFLREATVSDRNNFFQRVAAFDPDLTAELNHVLSWDEIAFSPRSTQRVQTRLNLEPKDAKVESFVARLREMLAPYGHIPIGVTEPRTSHKPVLEPVLSPLGLLLRVSPPLKGKR
jgi:hypothetical protein